MSLPALWNSQPCHLQSQAHLHPHPQLHPHSLSHSQPSRARVPHAQMQVQSLAHPFPHPSGVYAQTQPQPPPHPINTFLPPNALPNSALVHPHAHPLPPPQAPSHAQQPHQQHHRSYSHSGTESSLFSTASLAGADTNEGCSPADLAASTSSTSASASASASASHANLSRRASAPGPGAALRVHSSPATPMHSTPPSPHLPWALPADDLAAVAGHLTRVGGGPAGGPAGGPVGLDASDHVTPIFSGQLATTTLVPLPSSATASVLDLGGAGASGTGMGSVGRAAAPHLQVGFSSSYPTTPLTRGTSCGGSARQLPLLATPQPSHLAYPRHSRESAYLMQTQAHLHHNPSVFASVQSVTSSTETTAASPPSSASIAPSSPGTPATVLSVTSSPSFSASSSTASSPGRYQSSAPPSGLVSTPAYTAMQCSSLLGEAPVYERAGAGFGITISSGTVIGGGAHGAGGAGYGAGSGAHQRGNPSQVKRELMKTELCLNFEKNGFCTYGARCFFAHGVEDLRSRSRVSTFKSQPCPDPVRHATHACQYALRCHFSHPGEALRRVGACPADQYYDDDYEAAIKHDFGDCVAPWGFYV